jgi:hypothetical protein
MFTLCLALLSQNRGLSRSPSPLFSSLTRRLCGSRWEKRAGSDQWRSQEFIFRGWFNKFSWGQRAERAGIWGKQPPSQGFHSICKLVKPVFWLGCYGCIFHGTGNSAQFCQNFGISGGGGFEPPKPPLGTSLAYMYHLYYIFYPPHTSWILFANSTWSNLHLTV